MAERWEYHIERILSNEKGQQKLTDLGAQGWRVVSVTQRKDEMLAVIFERRLSSGGNRGARN